MMAVKIMMNIIYIFIKLFPVKKRITLISRIRNVETLDIRLLKEQLIKETDYEVVVLTKRLEKGLKNKLKYILFMFKKMYYLATSEVVVIDSYIISISLLKHKKKTTIIQMWHALGAFKQFGYSIIDKKEGSNYKLTKKMCMHRNYNIVICSSEDCIKAYSEAFFLNRENIKVRLLPRVSYLIENEDDLKTNILKDLPFLKNGKKNILYSPTFRKDKRNYYQKVIKQIDYQNYNLIITKHGGGEEIYIDNKKVYSKPNGYGITWLTVSQYVITDYSAIMYEAMLLNKKLYFYTPDIDRYIKDRGFYFDYDKLIPGFHSKNITDVLGAIKNEITYQERYDFMKNKYINFNMPTIKDEIISIITGGTL